MGNITVSLEQLIAKNNDIKSGFISDGSGIIQFNKMLTTYLHNILCNKCRPTPLESRIFAGIVLTPHKKLDDCLLKIVELCETHRITCNIYISINVDTNILLPDNFLPNWVYGDGTVSCNTVKKLISMCKYSKIHYIEYAYLFNETSDELPTEQIKSTIYRLSYNPFAVDYVYRTNVKYLFNLQSVMLEKIYYKRDEERAEFVKRVNCFRAWYLSDVRFYLVLLERKRPCLIGPIRRIICSYVTGMLR